VTLLLGSLSAGRKYAGALDFPRLMLCSYWFKYIIITPNQLTAAALVIQYWVDRDEINPGVFITIFFVASK
jgi:amino acid permease